MKQFINNRFQRWLDRRIPPAREVTLNQRRIFIFPSYQGGVFCLVLAGILISAINYANSMAYVLVFLLLSLYIVAILHTYSNLSGLTIKAGHAKPAFAGEDAEFEVVLHRRGARNYHGISLSWPNSNTVIADIFDQQELNIKLFLRTGNRGRMRAGRLHIESFYPLGLLRCWSWIDLDMNCLVYPKPLAGSQLPRVASLHGEGRTREHYGIEDFFGLRDYAVGDSLKHVSWKSLAKGQPLQTKQYTANVDKRIWLDWEALEGLDAEKRLSRLCYWTLRISKTEDEYGLRLPGQEIQPARGDQHRQTILRSLALFDTMKMVAAPQVPGK